MKKLVVCLVMVLVCAGAYAGSMTDSWTGVGNTVRPNTGGGFYWDETVYPTQGNWGSTICEWGDASHTPTGKTIGQTFKLTTAQDFGAFAFQLYRTAGNVMADGVDTAVNIEVWDLSANQVQIPAAGNTKLASFVGNRLMEIKTSTGAEWETWTFDQVLHLDADKWYAVTIGWNAQFNTSGRKIRMDNDAYVGGYQNVGVMRATGDKNVATNWSAIQNTGYNTSMDFALITPEPATVVLLGLGGLLLRKRK